VQEVDDVEVTRQSVGEFHEGGYEPLLARQIRHTGSLPFREVPATASHLTNVIDTVLP
jgi:hypothetical protein